MLVMLVESGSWFLLTMTWNLSTGPSSVLTVNWTENCPLVVVDGTMVTVTGRETAGGKKEKENQ